MPDGRRPHWTIVARVATSPPAAAIRCGETSPGIAVDHLRARARSRWNPLTPDNPKDLCRSRRWFRGDGDVAGRRGRSAHGRAACDTRWRRCHDLARRGVGGGIEITYSVYRERGSIDLLAGHGRTRTLLVAEVKSELASVEQTGRKLDEKVRIASTRLCRERFGWVPEASARLLVLPDTDAQRRLVHRYSSTLDVMFPVRGRAVRAWLRRPEESVSALVFLSDIGRGTGNAGRLAPLRVRRPGVQHLAT